MSEVFISQCSNSSHAPLSDWNSCGFEMCSDSTSSSIAQAYLASCNCISTCLQFFHAGTKQKDYVYTISYVAGIFSQSLMRTTFLWGLHLQLLCDGIIEAITIIIKRAWNTKGFLSNLKTDRNLILNVHNNATVRAVRCLKVRFKRLWSTSLKEMVDNGTK